MKLIVNTADIEQLTKQEPIFQIIYDTYGAPPSWQRPQGFTTLARIIIEQQLSLASAKAHFEKLYAYMGEFTPNNLLALTDEEMRNCHISRQKTNYLRTIAAATLAGKLPFEQFVSMPESKVREQLTALKGIGQWTADMYLLFCLQSKDILPLGDLAVANSLKELLQTSSVQDIEAHTTQWQPLRSLATFFLWHYYLKRRNREEAYD